MPCVQLVIVKDMVLLAALRHYFGNEKVSFESSSLSSGNINGFRKIYAFL